MFFIKIYAINLQFDIFLNFVLCLFYTIFFFSLIPTIFYIIKNFQIIINEGYFFLLDNNLYFYQLLQELSFLKKLFYVFSYYSLELFILLNIFVILTTKVKAVFKTYFWNLKVLQKNEIFFFKKTILVLFSVAVLNFILVQNNLSIQGLEFENNTIFINFQSFFIDFASRGFFINNFSTLIYRILLLIFFIFILFFYRKDLICFHSRLYTNVFIYFILLNFLLFFSSLFIICYDFFILFIILVGLNINIYSLLIFDDNNKNIKEASIKYFLTSTVGTLFILGSISLVFLLYKTTNFFTLHNIISYNNELDLYNKIFMINDSFFFLSNFLDNISVLFSLKIENLLNLQNFFFFYNNFIIILFLLIGLVFKLALFPLHSWAVEVYSSIKIRLLAIFILILKFIFFIKTIQIFFFVFQLQNKTIFFLQDIIAMISILSILFGSIGALFEDKVKRLLAFSSTNQLGFVFLGVTAAINTTNTNEFLWNSIEGLQASIFFLIIYLFSNLVLLWSLHSYSNKQRLVFLKDLASLSFLTQVQIYIVILSFSGLPPLAGFFSKFFILFICWKKNLCILTILAIFSSLFSSYYYLKIIKINLFDDQQSNRIIQKRNFKNFINVKVEKNIIFNIIIYALLILLILFSCTLDMFLICSLKLAMHTLYVL